MAVSTQGDCRNRQCEKLRKYDALDKPVYIDFSILASKSANYV